MPDEKRQPPQVRAPGQVERIEGPHGPSGGESRQVVFSGELHVGALPHPEFWERYEKAVPGTGLRLLKLVDDEQKQRWAFRRRGQWMGFATAVFFGGAAVWLIDRGKNTQALVFVIAAITPIVGGFLGRVLRAVEAKVLKKLDATVVDDD